MYMDHRVGQNRIWVFCIRIYTPYKPYKRKLDFFGEAPVMGRSP